MIHYIVFTWAIRVKFKTSLHHTMYWFNTCRKSSNLLVLPSMRETTNRLLLHILIHGLVQNCVTLFVQNSSILHWVVLEPISFWKCQSFKNYGFTCDAFWSLILYACTQSTYQWNLQSLLKIAELEIGSVCMETGRAGCVNPCWLGAWTSVILLAMVSLSQPYGICIEFKLHEFK